MRIKQASEEISEVCFINVYVRSYLIRCEFEYLAAIRDQIEFTRFILPKGCDPLIRLK